MTKANQHFLVIACITSLATFSLLSKAPGKAPASVSTAAAKADSERNTILGTSKSIQKKLKEESSVVLNDPAISQKWGLLKSDVTRAWELSQGSKDIVVAVIDTGIDHKHEDIDANLWVNKGETGLDSMGRDKSKNGIDDDGNGFVDDVHGWNFVSNNNNLKDNHGHGTHIAGIVGAEAGNKKGVSGVAPKVQMMILKYYDPKVPNTDNLKNTIKAIHYARKMNAQIINYSGGGLEFSQDEYDAIKLAQNDGILFVAAAGNERSNSDFHKYYPADYELDNIISVTAIDPNIKVLPSSNFGVKTVDIAAPGKNILSTLPGNTYGYMTGTSQATGFVTGAAVVVQANNPEFKYTDVRKYILATGDHAPSLIAKTGTSRRLNLFKALVIKDQGVAANGIIASNTVNIHNDFTAGETTRAPANGFSVFGKALLDKIRQKTDKKNIP